MTLRTKDEPVTMLNIFRWLGGIGSMFVVAWVLWVSTTLVAQANQIAADKATIQQMDKKLDEIRGMIEMLLRERTGHKSK